VRAMNDAVRTCDTVDGTAEDVAVDTATRFQLRVAGRTLEARGCLETLASGGTGTLEARVRAFFAARQRGPALLVGLVPFDPQAPDALFQPQSLGQGSREPASVSPRFRGEIHAEPAAAQYAASVATAVSRLRQPGAPLQKVVLARTLRVQSHTPIDPHALVARLGRDPDAVTYLAPLPVAAHQPPAWLVGASPERLVSRRGRQVLSHPLAGSAARHADPEQDARAARELLA